MCHREDLVFLLLESLLDLVKLRSVTNGGLQLCDLGAICVKAVGERVGEVASVKNEDLVPGLSEVGSDLVPSECARARDDKGLRGWIGGLEELAQVLEDFAEAVDKWLANVGFTEVGQYVIKTIEASALPVEAHGLEDFIVELNRSRDHESRMRSLGRCHLGCFFFLLGLLWFGLFLAWNAIALSVFKMPAAFR